MAKFEKGHEKVGGRVKGSKNKVSKRVLNALFENLKDAPESLKLLKGKDLAAFWRIAAAQIPKDLDVNHSGNINISVVDYQEDE